MTDAAKAQVRQAVWKPFGEAQSITGRAALDTRFPGQWFQIESGLHCNWHRHYDPTTGRYTQPDPLGFVDGPALFSYVRQDPTAKTDKDGRMALPPPEMYKKMRCVALRAQVYWWCKVGSDRVCNYATDDCTELQRKMNLRHNCKLAQQALTAECFPDNPTHGKRIADEERGLKECRRIAARKGCACVPRDEGNWPPGGLPPEGDFPDVQPLP